MRLDSSDQRSEVFTSWKEIAVYLGAGVRTVQRWEHDRGLPVRRPTGNPAGIVSASRVELDRWLAARRKAAPLPQIIRLSRELHIRREHLVRQLWLEMDRFQREWQEFARIAAISPTRGLTPNISSARQPQLHVPAPTVSDNTA